MEYTQEILGDTPGLEIRSLGNRITSELLPEITQNDVHKVTKAQT